MFAAVSIGFLFFIAAMVANFPWMFAFGRGHHSRWAILVAQCVPGIGWVAALIWSLSDIGHNKNAFHRTNWFCFRMWMYFIFFVCEVIAILIFGYGILEQSRDVYTTSVYNGVMTLSSYKM